MTPLAWIIVVAKAMWLVVVLSFLLGVVVGMTCEILGPPAWLKKL